MRGWGAGVKTAVLRRVDLLPLWTQLAAFATVLVGLIAVAIAFVHPDGYLADFSATAGIAVVSVAATGIIGMRRT